MFLKVFLSSYIFRELRDLTYQITKDTNKFSLLSFQIVAIRYNTYLSMFVQLPKTISKGLLWNRSQNNCHTIFDGIDVRKTCIFDGRLLVPAFVALSRSFLGFCLSMADPNVAHPQSLPSFRESVNTFSAHGFPPVHLHQHFKRLCCSFP